MRRRTCIDTRTERTAARPTSIGNPAALDSSELKVSGLQLCADWTIPQDLSQLYVDTLCRGAMLDSHAVVRYLGKNTNQNVSMQQEEITHSFVRPIAGKPMCRSWIGQGPYLTLLWTLGRHTYICRRYPQVRRMQTSWRENIWFGVSNYRVSLPRAGRKLHFRYLGTATVSRRRPHHAETIHVLCYLL
jgi:hypothetical protein